MDRTNAWGGGISFLFFCFFCMCGCVWVDAWQRGYVWACLSLNMTYVSVNIWVLEAWKNACWQLWKLWAFWLGIPFNTQNLDGFKPSAVMHFHKMYLRATATHWATSLHYSLIHGHISPFLLPSPFPPPHFYTPAPPVMDNPGWWWRHQGQYQLYYSKRGLDGQISVSSNIVLTAS